MIGATDDVLRRGGPPRQRELMAQLPGVGADPVISRDHGEPVQSRIRRRERRRRIGLGRLGRRGRRLDLGPLGLGGRVSQLVLPASQRPSGATRSAEARRRAARITKPLHARRRGQADVERARPGLGQLPFKPLWKASKACSAKLQVMLTDWPATKDKPVTPPMTKMLLLEGPMVVARMRSKFVLGVAKLKVLTRTGVAHRQSGDVYSVGAEARLGWVGFIEVGGDCLSIF